MKYLKIISCLVFFVGIGNVKAQNCGTVSFSNQAQVDQFVANNAGSCTNVNTLNIFGDLDLSGLTFITQINVALRIGMGTHLSSFQGLNNVQSIGRLEIDGTVTSFENLDNLTTIDFFIIEYFIFPQTTATIDLIGLESVTSLNKLYISNASIASFDALQNVASTSMERIYIFNCTGIQNIDFFNSLEVVTDEILINTNADLQTINGFNNLETVTNDFELSYNPNLTSISGFSSLLNIGYLQLWQNFMLNDCCILLPYMYSSNSGNFSIFGNASDCTNQNAVINYCGSFTDSDGDGTNDISDNCITIPNSSQLDTDNDGLGDACDEDIDGDGIINENDNCPNIANNNQADTNNDGVGDSCNSQSGVGTGAFGVGTNTPASKLHIAEGDVYIDNLNRGLIMKAPSGKCFRYKPNNQGVFVGKEVPCPN